jgi:hypothetical protein
MVDSAAKPPPKDYRLNDEQRRRVEAAFKKEGFRLPWERIKQLIREVEASIADYLLNARGASFRDAHEALRQLWNLSHEDHTSDKAVSKLVRALPRRAAEYRNRRRTAIDPVQIAALKLWEPDVNPDTPLIRVTAAEGAQIVGGRSRGRGRRSGRRVEPIIMGAARGAGGRTHVGGRPKSAEEEDLVMSLALGWLHAIEHAPTSGRSDRGGFGYLVHDVFRWIGLPDKSAAYALRRYWAEVRRAKERRASETSTSIQS